MPFVLSTENQPCAFQPSRVWLSQPQLFKPLILPLASMPSTIRYRQVA
jgi:hypothetical protein